MIARFWISRAQRTEEFEVEISEDTWERHNQLSARDPRMAFWAGETGDPRFSGHFTALIVDSL